MRTRQTFAVILCSLAAFVLTGIAPPKVESKKKDMRPKMEATDEIETMLGAMTPPEGYEVRTSTNGEVKLSTVDGLVIIIDALAADSVDEVGYTKDSVRSLLAKQFEIKVVKDPERPGDGVALRFKGFGSNNGFTVAFQLELLDTNRGAGMVLVYGPNSRREEFGDIAAVILDSLPL
jgi:hypothetical protein